MRPNSATVAVSSAWMAKQEAVAKRRKRGGGNRRHGKARSRRGMRQTRTSKAKGASESLHLCAQRQPVVGRGLDQACIVQRSADARPLPLRRRICTVRPTDEGWSRFAHGSGRARTVSLSPTLSSKKLFRHVSRDAWPWPVDTTPDVGRKGAEMRWAKRGGCRGTVGEFDRKDAVEDAAAGCGLRVAQADASRGDGLVCTDGQLGFVRVVDVSAAWSLGPSSGFWCLARECEGRECRRGAGGREP